MAKGDRIRKQALKFKPTEPKFENISYLSSDYNISLIIGLNYVNQNYDPEHCAKFAKAYSDLDLTEVPNWEFMNIGAMCYLIQRGATLSEVHINSIDCSLKRLQDKWKKVEVDNKPPQKSHRKAVEPDDFISSIEEYLDQKFVTKKTGFSVQDLIKLKPKNVKPAITLLESRKQEFVGGLEGTLEGYESYSKLELKAFIKVIDELLSLLSTKKPRKERKARKINPEKIVKKVKYMIEDTGLGIKSLSPTKILNANSVWLYNTEKRKIYYYEAEAGKSLSLKGTSILNYDESKSFSKKLRKPEETLKAFMLAMKVPATKLIASIKAVPSSVKGRLNNETLILKAY